MHSSFMNFHLNSPLNRFGEIGDIYRPFNLSNRSPRDFLFVRFFDLASAVEATREMNGQFLESYRISAEYIKHVVYFDQNETALNPYCSGIN